MVSRKLRFFESMEHCIFCIVVFIAVGVGAIFSLLDLIFWAFTSGLIIALIIAPICRIYVIGYVHLLKEENEKIKRGEG